MIHIAHIFMGKQLQKTASSFSDYIHRVGNIEDIDKYFISYTWVQEDGKWIASELNIKNKNRGVNSIDNIAFDFSESDVSDEVSIKAMFNDLYSKFVTIATTQYSSDLKVMIYVPLYDDSITEEYIRILRLLETLGINVSVDTIGITSDFVGIIEEDYDSKLFDSNQAKEISFTKRIIEQKCNIKGRFIVLQNRRSDGVALGLNYNSFITTLAEYALSVTECYNDVYPTQVYPGDVTGIGLSVLSLDKMYFVTYLMRRAFVKVLDSEQITQEKADVTKIQPIVNNCLQDKADIFKRLYENEISPLLTQKRPLDDIISEISPKLKDYFEELRDGINSNMNSNNLSLPEKQAFLAMLLGQDDDVFEGYLFNKDSHELDDCYETPVNLFVTENNRTLNKLRNKNGEVINVEGNITVPLNVNHEVYFPLEEKKKLKLQMSQTTQGLRMREDQLEELKKLDDLADNSGKRLTNRGITFEEFRTKLKKTIESQLQETYVSITQPSASVDLRESFPKIKTQGNIGTCSIFALSAIYEYILKCRTNKEYDLSERFVYYNACDKDKEKDSGFSFNQILKVMEEKGICEEEFCPYDVELLQNPPEETAFEDAKSHLVIEAKNVRIDHEEIRKALTDGYPVAISLRIYDSFDNCIKGFVEYPSDEEIQSENFGSHAMVICGYSDEDKVYIVRNSWGTEFGDKGYCYIPYSYIENPDLNQFCCVITKTQEGTVAVKGSKTVARFDKADNEIKQMLLKIMISEERRYLDKLRNSYQSLQTDYQQLIYTLQNQGLRNQIASDSTRKLEEMIEAEEEKYKEKLAIDPQLKDEFKKDKWRTLISLGCTALGLLVLTLLCLLFVFLWPIFFISLIAFAISLGILLLYFFYKKHQFARYKQSLLDEMAMIQSRIISLKEEKRLKEFKLHVAGMIIDKVSVLKHKLETKYNISKAYVGNLRIWRDEENNTLGQMKSDTQMPFMNVIENKVLDDFFDKNCDKILHGIRFSEYLDGFELDDNTMIEYKQTLKQKVIDRLFEVVNDFNMYEYISGTVNYPYLNGQQGKINTLLNAMDSRSDVFVQTNMLTRNTGNISKCILANVPSAFGTDWQNTYRSQFQITPMDIRIRSPYKLVVITTMELNKDEIKIINRQAND